MAYSSEDAGSAMFFNALVICSSVLTTMGEALGKQAAQF